MPIRIHKTLRVTPAVATGLIDRLWDVFLNVNVQPDRQVVSGLRDPPNPNLICVLLYLRDDGPDDVFLMRFLDLQALVAREYKPRERPKNVGSLHCALWPKHVASYRDRWDILHDAFALTRRAPAPIPGWGDAES
jgi:hypothetical protein